MDVVTTLVQAAMESALLVIVGLALFLIAGALMLVYFMALNWFYGRDEADSEG